MSDIVEKQVLDVLRNVPQVHACFIFVAFGVAEESFAFLDNSPSTS
jgi:hypothetical protein